MFHDIEQNTDEWLDLRMGRVTGSAISKVMANLGKPLGEPAKRYAVDLAVEQLTGKRSEQGYSNDHMARGHEQEPVARMLYERDYFCTVGNGGFFDNIVTGTSPDGLVGDNGVIEIKSVIASVHYQRFKNKMYDRAYRWQLIFNLKETGRDWIDFVSYCADFPEDKQLFVYRLHKKDLQEEFNQIDGRLVEFYEQIKEIKDNLTKESE